MSAVQATELVKLGLALMAAYLAVAGLLPKVLEKLAEVAGQVKGMGQQKKFEERYETALKRASFFASAIHYGYFIAGFGVITLATFAAFSDTPCNRMSCKFLWLPDAANAALVFALVQLVVTTYILLHPFAQAIGEILNKLRN